MSTTSNDIGRAAVYAAEIAAFDGTDLEQVRHVDEILRIIAAVLDHPWWPGPTVRAMAARRDARSSSTRAHCCVANSTGATSDVDAEQSEDRAVEIRIARPQATLATAAHELAHALAGVGHGHGPMFRRAHLDVIAVITNLPGHSPRGSLHVDQLSHAYAAADLDIGRRSWDRPPDVGGAIAL